GAGAVFLAVLGPRLLPAREPSSGAGGEGAGIGQNHALSTEVLVAPPQADARRVRQITAELGLTVLAVLRPVDDGLREMAAARGETPAAADAGGAPAARALLVEGPRDSLLRAAAARQVHLLAELKHPPDPGGNGRDIRLAEATLAPRSTLAGKTLRETDFYHRYGLTVIGIRRHGETIRQPLARVRLRFGDTLLLRGPRDRIRRLGPDPDFLLLEPVENPAPDYSRAGRAAAIFAGRPWAGGGGAAAARCWCGSRGSASAGWGQTPTSCCWSPWKTRRPTTAGPAGPRRSSAAPSGWRPPASCTCLWPPPWAPWPWSS